jgi:hypothetical protein
MLITLIEVTTNHRGEYVLEEFDLNPNLVAYSREEKRLTNLLKEGKVIPGLNSSAKFTRLFLSRGGNATSEVIVVGDLQEIRSKINAADKRQLLKG